MQVQGLSQRNVPMEFTGLYIYYSALDKAQLHTKSLLQLQQ